LSLRVNLPPFAIPTLLLPAIPKMLPARPWIIKKSSLLL
jgi:hypothetical protein